MGIRARVTAQDRLVTVSSTDSTPDALQLKVTSSDNSISLAVVGAPGTNQQIDLKAASAPSRKLETWIRVTAAVAKTYISLLDWRGRSFRTTQNYFIGTVANANLNAWQQYPAVNAAEDTFRVGSSFNPGADVQIGPLSVNSGANGGQLLLFIERGTGFLYVDSLNGGFSSEYQVELIVEAFTVRNAADVTI